MLAPDSRSVLLDLLRPPAGCALDRAVGTTFSVDLEAALAIPLAFASHRLSSTTDPIAVMEAVRSTADRVDVFCQAGQIRVPTQASDLVAFLEPMVHEVVARRAGHLFHPKVWLLRFTEDEDGHTPLRFVCLTRNLTRDASWDVALRLDGWVETRPSASNRPLVDLLNELPARAVRAVGDDRRSAIADLAESFRHAGWELPEGVTSLDFHVLGLDRSAVLPSFEGRKRVVVAPFCNDDGLDLVAPVGCDDITVVSTASDLDRLRPDTLARIKPRVIHPTADIPSDDAEPAGDAVEAETGGDRVIRGGLHAKLTVIERARQAIVFLGSANATDAAYGGNVEVVVELRGSSAKLGVDALLDVEDGMGGILEPYDTIGGAGPDEVEAALRDLKNLVRALAAAGWVMSVEGGPQTWGLTVSTARAIAAGAATVTVEVLTHPGRALRLVDAATDHGQLRDVGTADISPFLVIRATVPDPTGRDRLEWSTVVRATLIDDPESRLDEVLARQIDSPEKLVRFLLLVLGLGGGELPDLASTAGDGASVQWGAGGSSAGLFELLVRGLAAGEQGFDDIARLIDCLRQTDQGRAVLPDGFDDLWRVVCDARQQIDRHRPTSGTDR